MFQIRYSLKRRPDVDQRLARGRRGAAGQTGCRYDRHDVDVRLHSLVVVGMYVTTGGWDTMLLHVHSHGELTSRAEAGLLKVSISNS